MEKKRISRRQFIGTTAAGMAGLALMPSLTACTNTAQKPDIKLGFIGMGRQAMFLLNGFMQIPGVQVIAGCDVYGIKRLRFEKRVKEGYEKKEMKAKVITYERYQDLLANEEVNAVVIAVPDHSHAMIAIAACKAGKDVYLEKPMTFTIKEGQELCRVVRETGRVLAVGSQQRSDPNFQHAAKLVQSGKLGAIEKVHAYVGAPPTPYDLPEEPIPADLTGTCGSRIFLPISILTTSSIRPSVSIPKIPTPGITKAALS
ncbi:MAG TPA: Gfo/Idh/MocA family oxidoreductase [Prolixibacteraceae bacterium]|nr:Gfo/Idh/MocA family oxidoreductase [Prolixibacteraceae bacterium]